MSNPAEDLPASPPTEGQREAIGEETLGFFPRLEDAMVVGALPVAGPGRQGSIFKYPLQGLTGRYVLRVEEWLASGDNYYGSLVGTTDLTFPPVSLDAFDPDTDYWFGGGAAATDVLVMLNALGIGSFVLVTGVVGELDGEPYNGEPGFIRLQYQEDTGAGDRHYNVLWLDAATTWPVNMGFTDDSAPAAPQVTDGDGRALLTAQRPPEGICRLEYPPTDDTLPRTPVVVGKARTTEGDTETAYYGVANAVRLLFWAALYERVVITGSINAPQVRLDAYMAYSFSSVQQLLLDHVARGSHLRFYLRETNEPDDYWPCEATPPFTQDYERSQTDKSRLKWYWRIELSYSAED